MQVFYIVTNSILFSLKIIIPVFFIVRVCKTSLWGLEMPILIKALNYTLLLAGVAFVLQILYLLIDLFRGYYSGVEYEQYTFINRATGPYWFAFWLPVTINVLLPQLLWIKKVRASVKLLYTWFITASVLSLFISYATIYIMLHSDYIPSTLSAGIVYRFLVSPTYFALSLTSTLAILATIYWLISKKAKERSII